MKDHIEDFIEKNREGLDRRTPSASLWDNIEQQLPTKKRKLIPWRTLAVAASFLLVLGSVGTWAYNQGMKQGEINSMADISIELGEAEKHYQSEIKEKMAILASYNKAEEVQIDLLEMEEFLSELKRDLKDTPKKDREVVIQAMIENYRSRVELLEKVLDHLPNNSTHSKLSKDETKSI